jgi:acyl-CoA thioesterase
MPLPFFEHIGARIVESSAGSSLLALTIQPIHFNSTGVVHGGVPFTLADTGMGAALYPSLQAAEGCATIEIKINYFRPVTGGELTCRSLLVYRGRSTANLESILSIGDVVVSKANGTFAIFARKLPGAA